VRAFSRDGRYDENIIVTGSVDKSIRIWVCSLPARSCAASHRTARHGMRSCT
jgi:hypothetical protein